EELRLGACRAYNEFVADFYSGHLDRMAPTAVIPMHTPQEGIAELEHAKGLGLKAIMLPVGIQRPVPAIHRNNPELFPPVQRLDSPSHYAPFAPKCRGLGSPAPFHGFASMATGAMMSRSISNFVYNHIGAHPFVMHQVCKSLFLGGVPRRFPDLTFGFLECGV